MKETILFEQKTLNIGDPKKISKLILESLESEIKSESLSNQNINNQQQKNQQKKVLTIEEDTVNKHPIMQNILIILDHLYSKNPESFKNGNIVPLIIQEIINELKIPDYKSNFKQT
jgi:hypothetical protein